MDSEYDDCLDQVSIKSAELFLVWVAKAGTKQELQELALNDRAVENLAESQKCSISTTSVVFFPSMSESSHSSVASTMRVYNLSNQFHHICEFLDTCRQRKEDKLGVQMPRTWVYKPDNYNKIEKIKLNPKIDRTP